MGSRFQTHCKQGHLLEGDNLYIKPNGCRNCRECRAEQARKYREGKGAYSNWSSDRRARLIERSKSWKEKYPDRDRAHRILNDAVRKGRIQKQPCEICGSTHRIHGHHDDYNQPLKVRWLCPLHHTAIHKKD